MTDYISREAIFDEIKNAEFSVESDGAENKVANLAIACFRDVVLARIRNFPAAFEDAQIGAIPAADVRPVVRGKWNRTDAYPHRLYCSVCYKTYLKNDELLERWEFPLNFCPNCGADMREES